MKVRRSQEACLESTKGFYRGSKSKLTVLNIHAPKSVKAHEIHEDIRSIEIYGKHENLLKSLKCDESSQRTKIQPGIEQRFL